MTISNSRTAIVIGSGVAGLAAAVRLAAQGFQVSVLEANSYPGGKLSEIRNGNYRFDAGPSLFTMPHLVTELFDLAGKPAKQHFSYQRLPVICEYFWEDGTRMAARADQASFIREMSENLGEAPEKVSRFLDKSRQLYEITSHVFLHRSLHRLDTYLSKSTMQSMMQLHKLNIFRSMNGANAGLFCNPKTVQFFNRYATYNGSDPYRAPATLNIIPHLENFFGAYFPAGGMYSITQSIYQLACSLGVKFYFDVQAEKMLVQGGRVNGVLAGGESLAADLVVRNMDMVNAYKKLLKDEKQPRRLMKQPKSSSALIYYWGIKKSFPQLDLHNIFFSQHYREEFDCLFNRQTLYHDPTVYINISSKLAPADAPAGCEHWFTMVNAPNNSGQDWDRLVAETRRHIIKKLSRMLGENVENLIETEDVLDPRLIESRTSSSQGALYGNSSNNPFAAFLRHPNFSPWIKNLYFCGGSVHPGGGIPLSLLSAKIVGDLVEKSFKASRKHMNN